MFGIVEKKFLTTEEALEYLMSLDNEVTDSDPDMIILPPDPVIINDDKKYILHSYF